jgi:precorrin-6Y C5,15-methyltransferase (decarboxylating)
MAAIEAALAARPTRIVLALAALDRVGPAMAAVRAAGYVADGTQLAASRLATLPDGALRLVAENPVTVIWGRREAGT